MQPPTATRTTRPFGISPDVGRQLAHVAYGVCLGASIGFTANLMWLHAWLMPDRPDFLIRRGFEDVGLVLGPLCGAAAGLIYGAFLCVVAPQATRRLRLGYLYTACVGFAIPAFFVVYYLIVRYRVPLFFVPEISYFLLTVIATWHLVHGGRRFGENTVSSTERR